MRHLVVVTKLDAGVAIREVTTNMTAEALKDSLKAQLGGATVAVTEIAP